MGHTESKPSGFEIALEKLTDSEKKSLDLIFENSKKGDGSSNADNYNLLKVHLNKYFSPNLSDAQVNLLRKRCNCSTNKANVTTLLITEIVHLTHDHPENIIDFFLCAIQEKSDCIPMSMFKEFLGEMLNCFADHESTAIFCLSQNSFERFAKIFLSKANDIANFDEIKKSLLNLSIAGEIMLAAYKLIYYGTPITVDKESVGFIPILVPNIELPMKIQIDHGNTILSLVDVMYLNSFFPLDRQHKWRFLFSSNLHGESFSKFSSAILHQGPLLIIIQDQQGHVFGGYISTNLEFSSKFQGDEKCFLFQLSPSFAVFKPTGYNENYTYLNINQETIPNGLGMGGRHDYFGLWLSTEFGKGHCKARPTSTTYGSPRLSANEEFHIDIVEAWGIGNEPKTENEDDEEGTSVIDKNPDAVAMLRIAGREMASDGYRESERTSVQPEVTNLHETHNPME